MTEFAKKGRLDVIVTPERSVVEALPQFDWMELRWITAVLVVPENHPLAKLKKIPPARLRDLPLIGMARENYPDYVRYIREGLKLFGVISRFVALVKHGITSLFPALEANRAAALLTEGIASFVPHTLVVRRFSPTLGEAVVKIGHPAMRSNPHAALFTLLLLGEAKRQKTTRGPDRS